MITGKSVVSIDCSKKELSVQGGGVLSYDNLLFATGARPVSLKDINMKGASNTNYV